MFSLEEALEKCDKEELLKGKIIYEDIIPYSIKEIGDCSEECKNLMNVLEGLVAEDDIKAADTEVIKLLKTYILNYANVEEILDDDVDRLIELRLIISSESPYLEMLDKLMFRIYFEKERNELFGLIQSIYDKYDWTNTFINKYSDQEKTLIFQDETERYNKKFGIIQISNENKERKEVLLQEQQEDNWILKKFGD